MSDSTFYNILEYVLDNKRNTDDEIIKGIEEKFSLSTKDASAWYDSIITKISSE